jgi:ATP-dependent DNA helicase RecQ
VAATAPLSRGLLERLKRWRLETARKEGVPPYVVFHDRVLTEIAAQSPGSPGELAQISGVGRVKLERYGRDLLELVKEQR